jgi:beta-phosphoglucomutase-like phosphatase (HAD superfamily)
MAMRDFRYDDTARTFDEALEADLLQLASEKAAKHEGTEHEPESGIQRIAKGKTPLDEVRALIDASRQKSAAEEVAEHRVKEKLAELRDTPIKQVDEFLNRAKNG